MKSESYLFLDILHALVTMDATDCIAQLRRHNHVREFFDNRVTSLIKT
jgi:hypothetical protein